MNGEPITHMILLNSYGVPTATYGLISKLLCSWLEMLTESRVFRVLATKGFYVCSIMLSLLIVA